MSVTGPAPESNPGPATTQSVVLGAWGQGEKGLRKVELPIAESAVVHVVPRAGKLRSSSTETGAASAVDAVSLAVHSMNAPGCPPAPIGAMTGLPPDVPTSQSLPPSTCTPTGTMEGSSVMKPPPDGPNATSAPTLVRPTTPPFPSGSRNPVTPYSGTGGPAIGTTAP